MERLALRGGYYNTVGSGLFALELPAGRTFRTRTRGFRPAFAPDIGSFMVMAVRTEQGQKGAVSTSGKQGKHQQPHAAGRQRKRRGALFVRWSKANRERPQYGAAGFSRRPLLRWCRCRPVHSWSVRCTDYAYSVPGFPSRFRPVRRKPHGYGHEDGTGAKGGRFRPRRRENISSPTRPVDNESGVGHLSLRWSRANREWLNYGAAG